MRLAILAAISIFVTTSVATPAPPAPAPAPEPVFYIDPILFPLLFPTANFVGFFVAPTLANTIGTDNVEKIDTIADYFCIAAADDPSAGGGVCQQTLAGLYGFGAALFPADQAAAFISLMNTACIAPNTNPPLGVCQDLLGVTDCVANRIIGATDLECTGMPEPPDNDGDN